MRHAYMPSSMKGDLIDKKMHEYRELDNRRYPYYNMIRACYGMTYEERSDECYTQAQYSEDVAVLSDIIPYPKIILERCRSRNVTRVFMGAIPFLGYAYCIIDNSLNFWKLYSEKIEDITERDCTDIIHVTAGHRDASIFSKQVRGVIVYATERHLKIVPVTDEYIKFQDSIIIPWRVAVVDIVITRSGRIYFSCMNGYIYRVSIKRDADRIRTKIVKLPAPWSYFFLTKIEAFRPIPTSLAFDDQHNILAALNNQNRVLFYDCSDPEKPILTLEFNPEKSLDGVYLWRIVPSYAYHGENYPWYAFVAFTIDGGRVCFRCPDITGKYVEHGLTRVSAPVPSDQTLVHLEDSWSGYVAVFERGVTVARISNDATISSLQLTENYTTIDLGDEEVLTYYTSHHPMLEGTSMGNHPLLWPHLVDNPCGYLMTSKGVRILSFSSCVDQLRRIVKSGNGPDFKKFQADVKLAEVVATSALLAENDRDLERFVLEWIFWTVANSKEGKQAELDSIHPLIIGIILRTERILANVWEKPIIEYKNDFKLSIRRSLPDNASKSINYTRCFIGKCGRASIPHIHEMIQDMDQYLRGLEEKVQLLELLTTLTNKVISSIVTELDEDSQIELTRLWLVDVSLRTWQHLAVKTAEYLSESGKQTLETECPSLYNSNDIFCSEQARLLRSSQDDTATMDHYVSSICSKMSPMFDITSICEFLEEKCFWKGIVDLSVQKAKFVDPRSIGLLWYQNGCDKSDTDGNSVYNTLYMVYEYVINHALDCIPYVALTNDELLNCIIYAKLISIGEIKAAVSVKSQFIENFVKTRYPQYLWYYYENQREFTSAAIAITSALSDAEMDIKERVNLLRRAAVLASEIGKLRDSIYISKELAEVQADLYQRTYEEEYNWSALTADALFHACCEWDYWDLVIRLFVIAKIDTDNVDRVISQAWTNMFMVQFCDESLSYTSESVIQLITRIGKQNVDVMQLLPIMEEFRIQKTGTPLWVADTLLEAGIASTQLTKAYQKLMANKPDETDFRQAIKYITV